MRYGLLGPLLVHTETGDDVPVRGAKLRALLSLLLLERGAPMSQERLVEALWAERPPGNPVNALQAQVSQLRRLLGRGTIVGVAGAYQLRLEPGELDVERFERLVAEGLRCADAGRHDAAWRTFETAEALWRGRPLDDLDEPDVVLVERARLEELRLTATEARLAAALQVGRHAAVVPELEALVRLHPLRERLWELLMLALHRCGRQADALRAYQQARSVLVEELGLEPGEALNELEAAILARDERLVPSAPGAIGNVGEPVTGLVGRERELAAGSAALAEHRFVTLTGPGGVGKTRLARELARRDPPPGGAWFVSFESALDGAGVTSAIAGVLEVRDDDQRTGRSGTARLAIHLGDAPTLLVLDNCEHLLDAVARTTGELLAACPGLRVLATSREAVGLVGEVVLPVGPLEAADARTLFVQRATAVRPDLVLDDAASDAAAEICQRLDGLPLAIELAAARARSLPLRQIADRLDDRFRLLTSGARTSLPRQQTLRAVVDWSYDLLFDDERRLFARLAVFSGSFGLAAAESVCADELLPAEEVLDLLDRLVDKSLLVADPAPTEPRYRMLQTLWEYALERLAASGEMALLRQRHAAHHLELARAVEPLMRSGEALAVRDRLRPELENLFGALDWLVDAGDAAATLRLADDLGWLWFLLGDWAGGARFCERALAATGPASSDRRALVEIWWAYYVASARGHRAIQAADVDLDGATEAVRRGGDPLAYSKALLLRVSISQRSGDVDLQLQLATQGLAAAKAAAEPWLVAAADMLAAVTMLRVGRRIEAAEHATRAVTAFERIGDLTLTLEARTVLLTLAELDGRLGDAATTARRIVELADGLAVPGYRQWALSRLGFVLQAGGDLEGAESAHARALEIGQSRWGNALALLGIGLAARQRGELDRSRSSIAAATTIYDDFGATSESALARTLGGWVELDAGDLAAAEALGTAALAGVDSLGDVGVAALASELLAACALAVGDAAGAERLLRASTAIGIPAGHGLWTLTRADSVRVRESLAGARSSR